MEGLSLDCSGNALGILLEELKDVCVDRECVEQAELRSACFTRNFKLDGTAAAAPAEQRRQQCILNQQVRLWSRAQRAEILKQAKFLTREKVAEDELESLWS
ncbi:hypothetical protein WMY93_021980 [Mugilogobius chulae]|uniref:Uncharacterized protein n=1 Tax=Mugilogobius chulae TaxID=88201 RepID=A0AAW0NDQ3_9GOBI